MTIEDIIEEIIGEFTTTAPGGGAATEWKRDVDGERRGGRQARRCGC